MPLPTVPFSPARLHRVSGSGRWLLAFARMRHHTLNQFRLDVIFAVLDQLVGGDLHDNYDVKVIPGSTMPSSKFLRNQEIINAFNLGLVGNPVDPKVRMKVFKDIEFGNVQDLWKEQALDDAQVAKFIRDIENGQMPPLNIFDNHEAHLMEMNNYRKSDKFQMLDDYKKGLFMYVMEWHIQAQVDLQNPQRLIRALEVCTHTGKPFSTFRNKEKKIRNFESIQLLINSQREILYDRINHRVDVMMQQGLLDEVKNLYPYKHLNALNTVGYKELFDYLDGKLTLERAVELIKQNTRHFAKRQLTWFKHQGDFENFEPTDLEKIKAYIDILKNYL